MHVDRGRRTEQLARVASLLDRIRAGTPRPLVVLGEPGSGKTTTLDSLAEQARGCRVIRVAADVRDAGMPFAPLASGFRPWLEGERDTPRAGLALALLRDFELDDLERFERTSVFGRLRQMLTIWSELAPVVLCVDDLHAADPETFAAFWFLTRHLRDQRAWLVGASRPDPPELDPDRAALIGRLAESEVIEVVRLGALSEEELTELVFTHAGCRPSPRFVNLLAARAGGNPFFAVEILRTLEREGRLVVADGLLALNGDLDTTTPRAVSGAVVARVRTLGRSAFEVASCVAIFGSIPLERFALTGEVADLPLAATEEGLDVLVGAGVLVEGGSTLRFTHHIVRDSLYAELGPMRRRRLHARAAELLEARGDVDVAEIAVHARAAAIGKDAATADLLIRAGDLTERPSPRTAAGWYRSALDVAPTGHPAIPGVKLKLSRALGLAAEYGEAADLALELLGEVDSDGERARALELAISALRGAQRFDEAAALLESQLGDPALRTPRLALQQAQLAIWRERLDEGAHWLRTAEQLGIDDHSATLAEIVRMHLAAAVGDFSASAAISDRLRSRPSQSPADRANVQISLLIHTTYNGDPRVAIDDIDALATAGVMPETQLALGSWALYRLGRWDSASRVARESVDASTASGAPWNIVALSTLIALCAERDHLEAVEPLIAQASATPHSRVLADWAIASVSAARGDVGGALALLDDRVATYERLGRVNYLSPLLSLSARLAFHAGDAQAARKANAALQSLPCDDRAVAGTFDRLFTNALVETDRDDAVAAVEWAESFDLAIEAASARALLGAVTRDPTPIRVAYEQLARGGATARQRMAARSLRALGRRAPSQRHPGGALTPTEGEVARLVGRGQSNREIAGHTGLTVKTVETYVSRILAKTGTRSRVELAVAITAGRIAVG